MQCSVPFPLAIPPVSQAAPVRSCEALVNIFSSVLCAQSPPPPPPLWDSCMLSHTWHPALDPNYFTLPPACFLGFCAVWRVPFLQSAINIWTEPVQSEESWMLISLPNSAENQWVFVMAQGLGFPFLKVVFGKIFGNIYFVPLVWYESCFYLVFWIPSFLLLKERLFFQKGNMIWFWCYALFFLMFFLRLS